MLLFAINRSSIYTATFLIFSGLKASLSALTKFYSLTANSYPYWDPLPLESNFLHYLHQNYAGAVYSTRNIHDQLSNTLLFYRKKRDVNLCSMRLLRLLRLVMNSPV